MKLLHSYILRGDVMKILNELSTLYAPTLHTVYDVVQFAAYKENRIIRIRLKQPKYNPNRINQTFLLQELRKSLTEVGIPYLGCQLTFNDMTPKGSNKYRYNIEILLNSKVSKEIFAEEVIDQPTPVAIPLSTQLKTKLIQSFTFRDFKPNKMSGSIDIYGLVSLQKYDFERIIHEFYNQFGLTRELFFTEGTIEETLNAHIRRENKT